jgi:hypothetical protein
VVAWNFCSGHEEVGALARPRAAGAPGSDRLDRVGEGIVMASKEAYQKKFEAQLKEWDARLDVLSAKAQKATAEARISYENELSTLKGKRDAARKTLDELGKRGETAWEDMKDGMEGAWSEMSKAIEKVAARFR